MFPDAVSERFRQTSDDILRSRPEYHGPSFQKSLKSESSSKHELNRLPYSSIGPSPYDKVFLLNFFLLSISFSWPEIFRMKTDIKGW